MDLQIECARCHKPVDRCEASDHPYDDTIKFRVWCHGEVDNCSVPRRFLQDGTVLQAAAFEVQRQPKRLHQMNRVELDHVFETLGHLHGDVP